jgi:S-DNA-T family DNA segregation ATPase FtsK/SpoIIIE
MGTDLSVFHDGENWALSDLLPGIAADPNRGLQATGWPGTGNLVVPLGVFREPELQQQDTFKVDLSQWAGNIGITGAPRSGKTTLLRTLIGALALTHTPLEVQVYGLAAEDGLRILAGLPHVGAVADRKEPAQAAAIVWQAADVADQRRELFTQAGIESMDAVRASKRSGQVGEDPFGDIFVVVDDWIGVTRRLDGVEAPLLRIAEYGLRYGVHLVVTAASADELPALVRHRLGTWLDLAPGDPRDGGFAEALRDGLLPLGRPGYGIAPGPGYLSVALPRIDGARTTYDLAAGVASLVSYVAQSGRGQRAPAPDASAPFPILRLGNGVTAGSVTGLLGLPAGQRVALNQAWQRRGPQDHLRVPLGVAVDGTRLELDLKDGQQGGLGPHGLVVGAPGAGKAALLRSFVYSLALTHQPDAASFLLVDWTGNQTFTGCGALPHAVGVVPGGRGAPGQADRLEQVIAGELTRRHHLLERAGVDSIRDYRQARQQDRDLAALGALVIVVNGVTALVAEHAEAADILIRAGRLGQALGVHLLLADERLDGKRLAPLKSLISYVIALRTSTAEDSRAAIGIPDAAALPSGRGAAYLRAGRNPAARFAVVRQPEPIAVEAPKDRANWPRPLWLAPLSEAPTVEDLTAGSPPPGTLIAAAGIADLPFRHRQSALLLDLSGPAEDGQPAPDGPPNVLHADGNVVIAGAPGSGKTSLAATLVSSLARVRSPQDVQFYLLSAGRADGPLTALAVLPHVRATVSAGAASSGTASSGKASVETASVETASVETASAGTAPADTDGTGVADPAGQAVDACLTVLHRREESFGEPGASPVGALRANGFGDDPDGDVFLVIDGWETFAVQEDGLVAKVTELARNGARYGVHVVLTADTWEAIPDSVIASAARLELRLADPRGSRAGTKAASWLPDEPGHGLAGDGVRFLAARPGDPAAHAARSADRWPGPASAAPAGPEPAVSEAVAPEPAAPEPVVPEAAAVEAVVPEPVAAGAGVSGPGPSDPGLPAPGASDPGASGPRRPVSSPSDPGPSDPRLSAGSDPYGSADPLAPADPSGPAETRTSMDLRVPSGPPLPPPGPAPSVPPAPAAPTFLPQAPAGWTVATPPSVPPAPGSSVPGPAAPNSPAPGSSTPGPADSAPQQPPAAPGWPAPAWPAPGGSGPQAAPAPAAAPGPMPPGSQPPGQVDYSPPFWTQQQTPPSDQESTSGPQVPPAPPE